MRIEGLALVPVMLLVASACAGFPFSQRDVPEKSGLHTEDAGSAPGVKLEMQDIGYDGETLSGRLLVSPVNEAIRFDKRLITSSALSVTDVRDCATGQPLEYLVFSVVAPRPRAEDWLVLQPGYWYGKDVRIPLFEAEKSGQKNPECIEADIEFRSLQRKPFPRLEVRAVRGEQSASDAGTEAPPVLNLDAGAGATGP